MSEGGASNNRQKRKPNCIQSTNRIESYSTVNERANVGQLDEFESRGLPQTYNIQLTTQMETESQLSADALCLQANAKPTGQALKP